MECALKELNKFPNHAWLPHSTRSFFLKANQTLLTHQFHQKSAEAIFQHSATNPQHTPAQNHASLFEGFQKKLLGHRSAPQRVLYGFSGTFRVCRQNGRCGSLGSSYTGPPENELVPSLVSRDRNRNGLLGSPWLVEFFRFMVIYCIIQNKFRIGILRTIRKFLDQLV